MNVHDANFALAIRQRDTAQGRLDAVRALCTTRPHGSGTRGPHPPRPRPHPRALQPRRRRMNETDTCPCGHTINWHTPTGCAHADDDALEPWTDCTCTSGWRPRWCPQSGLGLIDHGQLPKQREFLGRCTCGTVIPVTDGQIAFHLVFDEVTA